MNKEQLLKIIQDSKTKLDVLRGIDYEGLQGSITELEGAFREFEESGTQLLNQNDTLQIGIVGQVKAGKSSFLNSLFFNGESVLPKASTPMTAGLTVLEYAEKNTFEVEYFNEADWNFFASQDDEYRRCEQEVKAHNPDAPQSVIRKEIESRTSESIRSAHEMVEACGPKAKQKIGSRNDVKPFDDINDLQAVLEQYVGANGEYTSVVKSLYIKMDDERLKDMRIVDTPGVNDPVVSRENRTRTFLHTCHGVFLLSSSTDFMGSGDVGFLNSRIGGAGIGTVVLLASKFDSVLQDIGADREMKHEERGDLADTAKMQTKRFKQRLREISDTIDESLRGRMKMDTTAGIGYSIAHKPSAQWDDMERQAVTQMKRYYPEYFATEQDIKESFEGIANIVEIREKYLEGVFMTNKDAIIAEKVNGFFDKNHTVIASDIQRILDEYTKRYELLNQTTIEEIRQQKQMQQQLFNGLSKEFSHIFTDFGSRIQNEIKHVSNNLSFNDIRTIPSEEVTSSITCKGWLWGHNTHEMPTTQVNTYILQNNVRDAIDTYARSWNSEWQKLFDKVRKEMIEKLTKAISQFETKFMSTSFDDAYYRTLIDHALDSLRSNEELSIGDVITDYKYRGDDIASKQYYPSGTYELEKEQVDGHLRRQWNNHKEKLTGEFRTLAEALKEDVRKEVNRNLSGAMTVINGMKTSFAENLHKEGEAYLNTLERNMQEKKEVLTKIEQIKNCLTELNKLYK